MIHSVVCGLGERAELNLIPPRLDKMKPSMPSQQQPSTDLNLDNPDAPAGPASPANDPAAIRPQQQQLQRPQAVVPVWPPNSRLDVRLALSTAQDPLAVDLHDETLPGVTWEGIEYSSAKFNKVWETEFAVPEVGSFPPPLSPFETASRPDSNCVHSPCNIMGLSTSTRM